MKKILVIRTDNIGDLVCSTPLFAALRAHFPDAWIGALVNAYNADVLADNPDIDEVFAYRKAKHRGCGESVLAIYLERIRLIWRLRQMRIDEVLLAAPGLQPSAERFARWIAPQRTIGREIPVVGTHEVERVFSRLSAYDISTPPPCRIVAQPASIAALREQLPPAWQNRTLIGLHISARKPSQRWPTERFVALARALCAYHGQDAALLLFWSPGSEHNPLHPGDDEKAQTIVAACANLPLLALPTNTLQQLISGLALCERLVCSDGGAMHVAAALGKPVVCFFGNSDASRWHPWGVPYELLQKDCLDVDKISVDEALAAYVRLAKTGSA